MTVLWKVKAIEEIEGVDFAGIPTKLPPGRRGYLEKSKAIAAAQAGQVEMLAPDGLAAMRAGYQRRDIQAEAPRAKARPKPKPKVEPDEPEGDEDGEPEPVVA